MDAEGTVVESAAAPEVRAQAEKMGWIPPERYKGDPGRFVDADEFIERGETVLPIVKAQNRRLEEQVAELNRQNEQTRAALQQSQSALDEINERFSAETMRALEEGKKQVTQALTAALEADDHEAVAALTGKMIELHSVKAPAPKATPAQPAPAAPVVDPDFLAWKADNPWFDKDKKRTALSLGIAQELREGGERATGAAFYAKVSAELENYFPSTPPAPRVASSSHGASGRTQAKSYAALPAEAKAACDAETKRFVGPGKKYQTADAWRARYAEIYFEKD